MSVLSRTVRSQLAGLVVVGAVVALVAAYAAGVFGTSGGHTITADFADAEAISKGNTVHVDGVTAGTVTGITLSHNVAHLTLHLADGFWPVHTDATARVRPVSLLGEDYVDLDPGSPSAPAMHDGGTITTAHTSNAVNLQTVLDAVNDPTATGLALFITGLGQGMAGQGANGAADLKALAPALTDTTALAKLLDSQDTTLQTLLDQVTPVTDALAADKGHTLDALVGATTQTMSATSAQATALGADLRALPAFLDNTTTAFNQLGTLSDQATPALAALDPFTSQLSGFSADLNAFATAAAPAVTDLTPVLTRADQFFKATGPVVASLQGSAPSQLSDAAHLVPIVAQGLTGTCSNGDCPGLDDIFGFVRNWALATQNYDGLSHYFRFFTNFSNTPVSGLPGIGQLLGALGTAPAASSTAPASTPAPTIVPPVTVTPPAVQVPGLPPVSLPTVTLPPVTTPPLTVPGLGAASTSGSATGLTPSQEHNLFSYLLGGS